MKSKVLAIWDAVRSSFWFVPAAMVVGAMALAWLTTILDEQFATAQLAGIEWIYSGSAEGARSMLSTVAGSMLTVAGLTFSITIAALTLASSQFGPRLLRNFMRDTGNQVVLGTFIAGFIYCLLVLRTVRGQEGNVFVPHISVTVGVGMALAGVAVLIYFIHHIAQSIQAAHLIARVGDELDEAIDRLFPERIGRPAPRDRRPLPEEELPPGFDHEAVAIPATGSGYLQTVDNNRLLEIATGGDMILSLVHRPGDWVVQEDPLVWAWPADNVGPDLVDRVNDVFTLGVQRTQTQDVEFPMWQLVEIAVRALSPGINDPHTAIMCIDRLGAALCRLSSRVLPSSYRYDESGQLRVIAKPETRPEMTDVAFNEIRQYGRSSASVTIRLLETIARVAARVTNPEDQAALLRQAMMIERGSHESLPEEQDRRDVSDRYQAVLRAVRERATDVAAGQGEAPQSEDTSSHQQTNQPEAESSSAF